MYSRSALSRGVCLAALASVCHLTSAYAQQSLPTIDIGGGQQRVATPGASKPRVASPAPTPQVPASPAPTNTADGVPYSPGQAVTRLKAKELNYIQLSPQGDLGQTLKFSPGVSVSTLNTPNEPIISIRGSGSNPTSRPGNFRNFAIRDIVLMSDGFPITTADGFGRTQTLDPYSFGGVDVYRGGSSANFGNYALFGAMNFKSYSGGELDGGVAGSEGGSFGYVKNYIRAGKFYTTPAGTFDISVFGSDARSSGYIAHSESEAQTANVVVKWSPTNNDRFTLKYMFNNTFANVPGALSISQFYLNPYQRYYGCPYSVSLDPANILCSYRTAPTNGIWGLPNGPQLDLRVARRQSFEALGIHAHNVRNIGGLRYEHDFGNAMLRTQFTYDYRDVLSGAQPPPVGGPGGPLSYYGPTVAIDARVDLTARSELFGMPASHYIGFIYNNARTNFATFADVPNAFNYGMRGGQEGKISNYTSNMTLRAREEIELTEKLIAAVAFSANWNRVWGNSLYNNYIQAPSSAQFWNVRLTRPYDIAVNNDYFNTAPEASLNYRYSPEWNFRARYAVGYSTPSFDSLTASPTGAARANANLQAQTSMGGEAGVDWTPNKTLAANATFFHDWYRNELQSQVSPYDNSINYMQNIPATIHRGVELGVDWRPIEGWRLFAAYTFSDFFFTQFQEQLSRTAVYNRAGNYLPGQPAHTLTARVGYDVPQGEFKGLGAYVEYNFRSAYALDNNNSFWIPGYGLFNANLHYDRDVNFGWIKNVSGFVEARNIFDTIYAASAMPFTNPVNAAGIQLPSPLLVTQGTIMPGAPRAVVAGLRIKF